MPEIRIGALLPGFCHGAFGSSSYADKRVEAIGADWVVVRETNGAVQLWTGRPEELIEFIYPRTCCREDEETDRAQ